MRISNNDVVAARATAIRHTEFGPVRWNARIHCQAVTTLRKAEYSLEPNAIHPACRSGVPGPAPAPEMAFSSVHIRSYHIRFDFVLCDRIRHVRVRHRIDHLIQLKRPVAISLK